VPQTALRNGRIVVTVGDVRGSGLKAAVVITKLPQAMQSAALIAADPNVMLDAAVASGRSAALRLAAGDTIAFSNRRARRGNARSRQRRRDHLDGYR